MRSEDATDRAILLDQLVEYESRLGWTRSGWRRRQREWFERPVALKTIQSRLRADEMILEYVLQRATVLLPLDLQERDWRGEVERGQNKD